MNMKRILQLMTRMRDVHPEMWAPVGWAEIKQIITREGVLIIKCPLSIPAQLAGIPGRWAILLNTEEPKRRWPYYAAHELGHLKLHVDQDSRFECCFHMERNWGDDPREDDAEFFATALMMGPRQAVAGALELERRRTEAKRAKIEERKARRRRLMDAAYDRTVNRILVARTYQELDDLEELVGDQTRGATFKRLMELITRRRAGIDGKRGQELWSLLQEKSGKPVQSTSISGTLRH